MRRAVLVALALTVLAAPVGADSYIIQDSTSNPLLVVNGTSGNLGVGTDNPSAALDLSGNLSLNDNYINNYFQSSTCGTGEVVDGINADGTYSCIGVDDEGTTESLNETLEAGNLANQSINLDGNSLEKAGSLKFEGNITIGDSSTTADSVRSMAIGRSASADAGRNNIIIGYGADSGGPNEVIIGKGATSGGYSDVVVGQNALSNGGESVAIGAAATANSGDGRTVALGYDAHASQGGEAIAIGWEANASGGGAVAFGKGSSATADRSIALGRETDANLPDTVSIGDSSLRYNLSVSGNTSIKGSGGLELASSDAEIQNFFADSCSDSNKVVKQVYANGTYLCQTVPEDEGAEGLPETLEANNTANQSIDMAGNDLVEVRRLDTSGRDLRVYDTTNDQIIANFSEGGEVSVPNGGLNVSGGKLTVKNSSSTHNSIQLHGSNIGNPMDYPTGIIGFNAEYNGSEFIIEGDGNNNAGSVVYSSISDDTGNTGSFVVSALPDTGGTDQSYTPSEINSNRRLQVTGNKVEIRNGFLDLNENDLTIGGSLNRTGNLGPELPVYTDDWIKDEWNAQIYQTKGTGSAPFDTYGDLIIQPRTSSSRDIILATGSTTPSIGLEVKQDQEVTIPNGNLNLTATGNITNISNIKNFFADTCSGSNEVIKQVYANGSYVCETVPEDQGVEGLPATLEANNTANQSINLTGENLEQVGIINSGGDRLDVGGDLNVSDSDILLENYSLNSDTGISIGNGSTSSTVTESIAIGRDALANGAQGTAIGYRAEATGNYVTAVGSQAGEGDSAYQVTAVGHEAGKGNSGTYSTAIGLEAALQNSGEGVAVLGHKAGKDNSGSRLVASGYHTGDGNSGFGVSAYGFQAAVDNPSDYMTALGYRAGEDQQGNDSTAVGAVAGYQNQGNRLSALGMDAGRENSADRVTAAGYYSAAYNQGSDVVAVGHEAGLENRYGRAVMLGSNANASATGAVAIGYNATSPNPYETTLGNLQGEEMDLNVTGNATIHGIGGLRMPNGVVIGNSSTYAEREADIAVGKGSYAGEVGGSEEGNLALGWEANASGGFSTAIGSSAQAEGPNALALGENTQAIQGSSLALGSDVFSTADSALGIGTGARPSSDKAVTIGYFAGYESEEGNRSIVLGNYDLDQSTAPVATGKDSVSLGTAAQATAESAVAIGDYARAPNSYEATFGNLKGNVLDLNVTGNATVHGKILDLKDGNISNYWSNNLCGEDRAVKKIHENGTVECTQQIEFADNVENLSETLEAGNVANQTINLSENGLASIGTANFSGGIRIDSAATANSDDIAIGSGAQTIQSSSDNGGTIAIGQDAFANSTSGSGNAALAIGDEALAEGLGAVALGEANAPDANTVAVGRNANVSESGGVAVGASAEADNSAVAVGNGAISSLNDAVAIGDNAEASGNSDLALGDDAIASGVRSVAIGDGAQVTSGSIQGIAIGDNANATADGAVAIGKFARAPNADEATFGNLSGAELDLNVTGNATIHGEEGIKMPNGVTIGNSGAFANGSRQVAIGRGATANNLVRDTGGLTALGSNSNATRDHSTALGEDSLVTGNAGLAVGYDAEASGVQSTAIGGKAKATGDRSVAIGREATAPNADEATFGNLDDDRLDLNVTGNLTVHDYITGSDGTEIAKFEESGVTISQPLSVESSGPLSVANGIDMTDSSSNTIDSYSTLYLETSSGSPSDIVLDPTGDVGVSSNLSVTGDLDLDSGDLEDVNNITGLSNLENGTGNFFQSSCSQGQVIGGINADGSYDCIASESQVDDVWVNESGDNMSGALDVDDQITANGMGLGVTPSTAENELTDSVLYADGNVEVSGDVVGAGGDLAEKVNSSDELEEGEVAVISGNMSLDESTEAYDTAVAGVISTDPGIVLAKERDGEKLGLSGIVPVKVTVENGDIKSGDLLTPSDRAGKAMKCRNEEKCENAVIGKAMQSADENGKINVLLTMG